MMSMSLKAALAWSLAAFVGLNGVLIASVQLRPAALTDLVHVGGVEAAVFVALCAALLRVHAPDVPLREGLALRPTSAGLLAVCFATGLCLRVPADFLRNLMETLAPTPETVLIGQSQLLKHETLGQVLILISVLAMVGPLVEELFYRGALFGSLLRDQGALPTVLLTSLAFVLTHGQWRDFPTLLLVALILGYVRAASGSLLPALALHSAFNLSAIWALLEGLADASETLAVPPLVTLTAWSVVILLLFAVHRISTRSELAVRAREDDLQ
jgi:membrane protease YdiL (CAAX protease family)